MRFNTERSRFVQHVAACVITQDTRYLSHVSRHARSHTAAAPAPGALGRIQPNPLYQTIYKRVTKQNTISSQIEVAGIYDELL